MPFSKSHNSLRFVKSHTLIGKTGRFALTKVSDSSFTKFFNSHLNYGALGLSPSCKYFRFFKLSNSTIYLNWFSPKYKSVKFSICPMPSMLFNEFLTAYIKIYLGSKFSRLEIRHQFKQENLSCFLGSLTKL